MSRRRKGTKLRESTTSRNPRRIRTTRIGRMTVEEVEDTEAAEVANMTKERNMPMRERLR